MPSALLLRTCGPNGEAHGGFVWPLEVGAVVKPERWDPRPHCGDGLHGALWGEGDGDLFNWDDNAVWMVVEAEEWVDLRGKVKASCVTIRHVGDRASATACMAEHAPGRSIIGGTATAGCRGTATAGDGGTVQIKYWDSEARRYRIATGYVGEDSIEANLPYMCDDGELVRVVADNLRDSRGKGGAR